MSGSGSAGGRPRLLLLGVGNTFQGDDGAGYCLVRAIEACGGVEGARLAAVQHLSPGQFALLEDADEVVIVDAYVDEEMPEGARVAVLELDPSRLSSSEVAEMVREIDPHSVSPLELIVLAHAAGVYRGRSVLVGVRPSRIEFGAGLSGETLEALVEALKRLREVLEGRGARLRADPGCVEAWLRERCRGPLLE